MSGEFNRGMTQEEFEAAAALYREWKAAMDEAALLVEESANALKAEMDMRGVEKAKAGLFEVRYQTVRSVRLDSKALKAAEPVIFSQYTVESESKRFMVA